MKCSWLFLFAFLFSFYLCFAATDQNWSQQTLANMSLDEKIGQLFMIAAYSNPEDAKIEKQNENVMASVEHLIRTYHVGGVLLKRNWEPLAQVHSIRHFQSLSKIPLFIAQDCEWGLAMRCANTMAFPKNMTLGAIQDDQLLLELGQEIGRQCRLVGINFNLAPVVDVNSNPANPVIGSRSFGDDPDNVARKGTLLMEGIQQNGVMACAKHFPGHGDTNVDSHHDLPIVLHDRAHLNQIELYPFKKLIDAGVMAVMSAHVVVPALSNTEVPATLSSDVISKTLKGELGYQGLVITDDLMMGAIAKHYPSGEAALLAFIAGNDILLSSHDIPACFDQIKQAVVSGKISLDELDARVLKILKAKEWIYSYRDKEEMLAEDGDWSQLRTSEAETLKRKLYQEAITVLGELPSVSDLSVCVQIGGESISPFYQQLAIPRYFLSPHPSDLEVQELIKKITSAKQILVALYPEKVLPIFLRR